MAGFDDSSFGGYYTPPPGSGFSSTAIDMQSEISSTMKSLKDTLSSSFQTLNLTLMSMNSTLKNVGGTMRSMAPSLARANTSYLPATGFPVQHGNLSANMASHLANSSLAQLYTGDKPFNVSSLDYGYQLSQERGYRFSNMGINVTGAVGGFAATGLGAWGLQRGIQGALGGRGMIGKALGSGIGRIGLGLGSFAGASMLLQPIIDAVIDEATSHVNDTAAIKRMSTRFGNEFTTGQAASVSRSLRTAGYKEMMNSDSFMTKLGKDGYKDVLMSGLAGGIFHGSSPEELIKQMKNAAQTVKFLAGVMGDKDVAGAMQSLIQLKGMGLNVVKNPGFVHNMGIQAYKYGATSGLDAKAMLNMGMQGSQIFQQAGMAGFGGIVPMMRNLALAHEMEKRHIVSTAELSLAGGAHGLGANMTAATAGILGSAQFGDVMLASGFNGKGFSAGMAGKAAQGGYFGMVGAGARNILRSPGDMARFFMNKTDMHAQIAESGNQQAYAIAMVRSALENAPFMKGASYRDKEPMVQMYTKQILEGLGMPADTATVKAIAAQVLHPNAGANMDSEANRALERAKYYDIRERTGTLRSFGRIKEGFERIPGALHYKVTGRLGLALGDSMLDLSRLNYGEQSNYTAGVADGGTLTNTLSVFRNGGGKLKGINDTMDARDIAFAFKRMAWDYNGVDVAGSASGSGGEGYNPLASGNFVGGQNLARDMAPGALGAAYRSEASYYNKLLNGINDGKSSTLARYALAKNIMGSGGNYKEFMDYMDNYANSSEGIIFKNSDDTVALGMQGVFNYMKTHDPRQIANISNQFLASDKYKKFSMGYSPDMISKLGISGDLNQLSPSELMRMVAQSGNASSIASQYGMTTQNLAAAISQKVYGKIGGNDSTALWGMNADAMNHVENVAAAWETGAGRGDKLDRVREILESGLTLNKKNSAYFKDLGFDDDMLSSVLKSDTGISDMNALGNLMNAYANGQDYSSFVNGIKSDAVGGLADKMLRDMSPEQMKAALKKLGGDGTAVTQAAMAAKGDATLRGQTSYLFGRQGGAVADAFKNASVTGNFDQAYQLIMGMNSDDAQVQDIQSTVNGINRAKLSGKVGDLRPVAERLGIDFDKLSGKSMAEIESTIMGTALQSGASDKEVAEKQQQLDNNDYRFAMTQDGKAFRVVIDNDQIRAKSEADKTAENMRKNGNVFTPDNNGSQGTSFPTTPGGKGSNVANPANPDSNWANLWNRFSMGTKRV